MAAVDENQIQEKLQAIMQDFSDNEGDDGDRHRRAPLAKAARGGDRPRPSAVQPRMSVLGSANRRRSSIFLRRTSVGGSSVATLGTLGTTGNSASQAHLDALYKKAIRMNAENRINAANSWNLNLIEHIDKFVHDDEGGSSASSRRSESNRRSSTAPAEEETERRVNFTKASCTLDASIKIYSYRVDDVHLTSYKVLANLSRNDADGAKAKQGGDRHDDDDDDHHGDDLGGAEDGIGDDNQNRARNRRKPEFKATGPTLESNISNINMNKLDSAFDIDPLFHKMSKNFDEGGAKGLLLVNLGLGPNCNIVFDSSGDEVAGDDSESPKNDDGDIELIVMEHLTSKLLDPEDVLTELPLVPQLANLRAQLEDLALEGFLDDGALVDTPSNGKARGASANAGRRYAANDEEEDEADVTIHQEVAERSLRLSTGYEGRFSVNASGFGETPSQPGSSAMEALPDDGVRYAPDDFGGGDDDCDDYGGTALVFDDVEVADGVPPIPSPRVDHRDKSVELPFLASSSQATSHLLDKISSSSHVLATSDYEFLSARMMQDNAWAGAAFWKRKEKRKAKATAVDATVEKPAPKKRASRKKQQTKGFVFDVVPDLSDILVKPKKQLLQWSRAVINKHSKEDNLLPLDAGFGVEKLSQLFLRPDMTMLSTSNSDLRRSNKAVDFDPAVETWASHGDDSFGGGDDDGPGYDFGDDNGDGAGFEEDDAGFVVPELKGVRKVEKVHVGYATVAKKVDVKRLKKDLWDELESHFVSSGDLESQSDDQPVLDSAQFASFQTVVHDLESSKSQPDASLPFYFICMLHLANEKGLRLESKGLGDFDIYPDSLVNGPSF